MTDVVSELDPEVVAKTPTDITVTAYPLDYEPWVYFSMTALFPKGGGKKIGENLKFDKLKGEFQLRFVLDDKTTLGLAFCRDFADAMWVAVGPTCPTVSGNGGGAITPGPVADPPVLTELVAINANGKPEMLSFALRFTGSAKEGFPPYVYDPKIINGGV